MAIKMSDIMADPTLLERMHNDLDGKDGDPRVEIAEWHPDEPWPYKINGKDVSEAEYYEKFGALIEVAPPVGPREGIRGCGNIS